jgi:hypothetical protein
MIKTTRPLENNQVLHFAKRLTGDEADEEEIAGVGPADPLALFKDRSIWTPPRPLTPVRFHGTDPEPEDSGEYIEKIMTQIIAGPHQVILCLAKNASIERAIEVLHRRTGITGKWEGRVTTEGGMKKGTPRVIELTPIEVRGPPGLPQAMSETRIFFGTLEHKGAYYIGNEPGETLTQAIRELRMDEFWELDRSFKGSNKAPPTIIAKRNEPKPMCQVLPTTIECFVADHVEKERQVNQHKIKSKGGETPDKQAESISKAFSKPMEISV